MSANFRLISLEHELKYLENSLVQLLPKTSQIINLIRLQLQNRFPQNSHITFHLYEENQTNSISNGHKDHVFNPEEIFLVCIQIPNIFSTYGVITLAPESLSPKMLEAFENLIDWDKAHLFSNNDENFSKHLEKLAKKHGKVDKKPGKMFFMDPKIALESPNFSNHEIQVKSLSAENVPKVLQGWKMAKPHSNGPVGDVIKNLESIGIFVDSELASSALLSTLGLINIVYTEEKHRRKGFGEKTILALSKSIAKLGLIPGAEIESWNDTSQALLLKAGFKLAFHTNWFFFEK